MMKALLDESVSILVRIVGECVRLTHGLFSFGGARRAVEGLPQLKGFEVHTDRVARVLACNPGRFTLHGTNCYVVGKSKERYLIDTGEGLAEFDSALKSALSSLGATISTILLTHGHVDHVGGVDRMKKLFPGVTVRKFPDLSDGESLRVDAETTLRVLHTPGHCEDHCCFVLDQEKAIFSGDNVLGIGSPWFEHLGDYMASLQKMATIATNRQLSTIYPSHGPPSIENALAMIQDTAKHRMEREAQIIKALSSKKNEARGDQDDDGNRVVDMRRSPKSALTSLQLVYRIYDASLPTMLVPAAQSNVLSHLHKLKAESAVCHAGLDRWYL